MTDYPTAVDSFMDAVNALSCSQIEDIQIGDTTINCDTTTGWKDGLGSFHIANEIIFYDGVTATSFLNCVRGSDGTTEAVHLKGSGNEIQCGPEAHYINDLNTAVIAIETELGITGAKTYVSKTGNETVAGIKTFSSSPIVPTPTTDMQAATKKYGDDTFAPITTTVTLAGVQTLTGAKTVAKIVQTVTAYTPASAGTTTINLTLGNVFTVTMPADTQTLAISNETVGQFFIVHINNVTSQGALTWFSTIKWVGGTEPTLTGTNAKRDTFGFECTGTDTYDGFVIGQNI